ncbi:MAG: T9SS type A sorting domain-containing protein [Hymenobacter sp.]|nr:MAG: T9SS type A sorting domain-containing protein [Hymenobacter sp.]
MPKTFMSIRSFPIRLATSWRSSLVMLALGLGHAQQGHSQGLVAEAFQSTTSSEFTLGGTATLTAATGVDPDGAGYLRLTTSDANQSGFAIGNSSFPATQGFSISFEFFAYQGGGVYGPADGFSMFLVDASQTSAATFTPGASGGSLGYAQKTISPPSNGVPFGYFGIGIDEFGNYSAATEGRVGGPGPTPDAVALRGAGNGNSSTDYPYLSGTATLPFSIDVPTARAQPGSTDYRRAYVDVVPTNGTYRVTVRIQHGGAVETVVRNFEVPQPPANLRIGFAGSTGDGTDVHELRKLAVKQAPFLRDDDASTGVNQAVTFSIIDNDVFSYANYTPGSVDLDISQPGIQSSLTLPDQGTLTVTPAGQVTFTPTSTFTGQLIVPYTTDDDVNQTGAPANINISVAAPLPVSLISFSASTLDLDAHLQWATASERTNERFVVERSLDATSFVPVGTVAGQGTTTKATDYLFTDNGAASYTRQNSPVYYRLRQVDSDGTRTYSPVRAVLFSSRQLISCYPNPAGQSVQLNLSALPSSSYQVQVLDLSGRQLAAYSLVGGTAHTLDLKPFAAGLYFVRVVGQSVSQALLLRRE